VVLLSVASNYIDEDYKTFSNNEEFPDNGIYSELFGTLHDIKISAAAFQTLSNKANKDFYWIPMLQDQEKESDSSNFATIDNLNNTLSYLAGNSVINKPTIIRNPNSFELFEGLYEYKEYGDLYTDDLELNSNDILIIYYSGHGFGTINDLDDDRKGDLIMLDKIDSGYELNIIKPDTLYNAFEKISGKKLLISDSCFSGNLIPSSISTISVEDSRVTNKSFYDKLSNLVSLKADSINDLFVISASRPNELSYEIQSSMSPKITGAFTSVLLKGLGWDIEENDEFSVGEFTGVIPSSTDNELSVDDIYSYTKDLYDVSQNEYRGITLYNPMVNGGRLDLVLFQF
jgi:hypothetical protein